MAGSVGASDLSVCSYSPLLASLRTVGELPLCEGMKQVIIYLSAILPCRRQWSEENIPGEEPRPAVSTLRPVSVHTDYRHSHQDICALTDCPG